MKILVTGSSGFIGQWVCRTLQREQIAVVGLDSRPATTAQVDEHITCDIRDRARLIASVRRTAPDAVIHLAARIDLLEKRDLAGYGANTDGVRNLIAAVRETPSCRRVVHTSSQLVCRVGYAPTSPTDYCPNTVYGESKVLTEQIVREEGDSAGEWCLARPTTVWGPGMSPHYQTMLRLIARGRYFHCGNSPLLKSYSYAENIAWQYLQLVRAPRPSIQGKTFYLCDYEPLSLRRYANDVAALIGAPKIPTLPLPVARGLALTGDLINRVGVKKFPFNSFRLKNILTEYVFDTAETAAVCGSLPVTYAQGVAATARWFQDEVLRR